MGGRPPTPTTLLRAWRDGDQQALNSLTSLLYEELSRLASGALRRERPDHTLQTRALVHEAYVKLLGSDAGTDWKDRAHFLAVAARAMRRILTDHARGKQRDKRGGGEWIRVDISADDVPAEAPVDAIELETALVRLEALDERKARLIELHYFTGLSYEETAEALGLSPATVGRELRLARAWLGRELHGRGESM